MLTFRVDFNDRTEDGRLVALVRQASGISREPRVGDNATLRDAEGNRLNGRVERIDGALAYIVPDWDSWLGAERLSRPTIGVDADIELGPSAVEPEFGASLSHTRRTERETVS
jgi:hypothetical protein